MNKILVVDDDWGTPPFALAAQMLHEAGFDVGGSTSFQSENLLEIVEKDPPQVVLLDILRGERDEAGLRLFDELGQLPRWAKLQGSVQIVFCSSHPTARRHAAVAMARRVDVSGFLSKNDLFSRSRHALGILEQAGRLATLYKDAPVLADPELRKLSSLVFSPNSTAMRRVWDQILLASRNWEPVLISGETGTGKEVVAQAIFKIAEQRTKSAASPLKGSAKLLPCNIGAMPREGNLQYVELFGAKKGSASGIDSDRIGLFERAHNTGPQGGTVFLDEIGDAPPIIQVSLLRVLQENKISPMGAFNEEGGAVEKPVKFRLIAASHVDLGGEATKSDGRFRLDLYHRLRTIRIHVPPLKERKDDIGVLMYAFLDRLNDEKDGYGWGIHIEDEKELLDTLKSYNWPGNVRELEMMIRSSYVSCVGKTFRLSDDARATIEDARARSSSRSATLMSQGSVQAPFGSADSSPFPARESAEGTGGADLGGCESMSHAVAPDESMARQMDHPVRARHNGILESLTTEELASQLKVLGEGEDKPSLSDLESLFGIPSVIRLYRYLAEQAGRNYLNDADAGSYFNMKEEAARRWVRRAEERLSKFRGVLGSVGPDNQSITPHGAKEE